MKNIDRRDEVAFEVEHDEAECEVSPAALAQPFPLGALLREEVEQEIAKRDGEWNAFTAHVFRKADQAELVEARMSLEERAVEMMRAEVGGELAEMLPRFDRDFRDGVEQRIWRSAREQPSFWSRASEWFASMKRSLSPRPIGFAMAAAAAVAIAVTYAPVPPNGPSVVPVTVGQSGRVSVDRVSFEGTATVLSDEGITVLWLTDDATS
jgi:hypothetical protein